MARVTRATLHMSADASEMKRGLDVARKAVSDLEGQLEKQIEAGEDYSKTLTDLGRADARAAQRQKRLDQATKKATLSTRKHTKAVKEAKQEVDGYGASLSRAVGGLKGLAAAAGVGFVVRGLFRAVQDAAELGSTLLNTSRALNVTVEEFQGLDKVFRDTGGTTEQMSQAMRFFQTQAGRAARGAETAFRRYGIEVGTVQENLGNVAALLAGLPVGQRLTIAAEFFGEEGGLRAVAALAGGLEDFISRFEAAVAGAIVSTPEAERLNDVNQSLQDFADSWRSSMGRLVAEVGPELINVLERASHAVIGFTNTILGQPPGTFRAVGQSALIGAGVGAGAGAGAGPLLALIAQKGADALTARQAREFERLTGLSPRAAKGIHLMSGDDGILRAMTEARRERQVSSWMDSFTRKDRVDRVKAEERFQRRAATINNRLNRGLGATRDLSSWAKGLRWGRVAAGGAAVGAAAGSAVPIVIEQWYKSYQEKLADDVARLSEQFAEFDDADPKPSGLELSQLVAGIYRDYLVPSALRAEESPLEYLMDPERVVDNWPLVAAEGDGLPPRMSRLLRDYAMLQQSGLPGDPETDPFSLLGPELTAVPGIDPELMARVTAAAIDDTRAVAGLDRELEFLTEAQLTSLMNQADNMEGVRDASATLRNRLLGEIDERWDVINDVRAAGERAASFRAEVVTLEDEFAEAFDAGNDELAGTLRAEIEEFRTRYEEAARDAAPERAEAAAEALIRTYLRLADLTRQVADKRQEIEEQRARIEAMVQSVALLTPGFMLSTDAPRGKSAIEQTMQKRDEVLQAFNEAEEAARQKLENRVARTEGVFRGLADALFQAANEAVSLGEALRQMLFSLLRDIGAEVAGNIGRDVALALFDSKSGDSAPVPGLAMGGYASGGWAMVGEMARSLWTLQPRAASTPTTSSAKHSAAATM